MGAVFLGEHTLIGRFAAIKVLLPELSAKRRSIDRFFTEARATSAIPDPGIVQIFDFGFSEDKTAYLVMEYLEGEPVDDRLRRLGAFAPADALRLTRQVAGSLEAAHAVGIVHRDLKPENLFIVRDPEAPGGERPKILDFGLAKLDEEDPDRIRTRPGAVLGTPMYMSPEQCDGASTVDHRADIYALGCVLFHLLTGRPPFDVPGIGAAISAHLREPPPIPSSLAPHLPPAVDDLVLRCLEKSPGARYASMFELQQACDAILARITAGQSPAAAPALPIGVPRTRPLHEPAKTTLGTSAGQPFPTVALRKRVGMWVGIAAISVVVGASTAIITARTGPQAVAAQPPAVAAPPATLRVPPAEPVAPAVATTPPAPAPPAIPIDAGASVAPTEDPPAPAAAQAKPHPAETHRPAARPGTKPTPAAPRPRADEDLYEDRN
jgi:eukaryotic-like serine/threonine-protein kinase